tara:strand:+ start:167 stop:799 length:633 start_codon:yes stop_codon:yes gene_type:complete
MAKQIIQLGSTQDDGTGSTLRAGGDIINDNFSEIYTKLGDGTTLSSDTFTLNTGSQTLTNKSIDSDNNTITNIVNADIKSAAAIDASKIANGNVSSTEFQYLDGVTSAIQTQINAKLGQNAFSTNQNGYMTFSNGLIIQWGRQGSLSNGSATDVNFPITFPSACWAVAASWSVMTSGTHHSAFPTITTSKFTAHNVSGSTNGCYFIAVGN